MKPSNKCQGGFVPIGAKGKKSSPHSFSAYSLPFQVIYLLSYNRENQALPLLFRAFPARLLEQLKSFFGFHNGDDFGNAYIRPTVNGRGEASFIVRFKEAKHPVTGNVKPFALNLYSHIFSYGFGSSFNDLVPVLRRIAEYCHEKHKMVLLFKIGASLLPLAKAIIISLL
jgi:hypothetical protein